MYLMWECGNATCKPRQHQHTSMWSSKCCVIHYATRWDGWFCCAMNSVHSRSAPTRVKPKHRPDCSASTSMYQLVWTFDFQVRKWSSDSESNNRAMKFIPWLGLRKSISDTRLMQLPAAPTLAAVLVLWLLTNMWLSVERKTRRNPAVSWWTTA